MYCRQCGQGVAEGLSFCTNCGAAVPSAARASGQAPPPPRDAPPPPPQGNAPVPAPPPPPPPRYAQAPLPPPPLPPNYGQGRPRAGKRNRAGLIVGSVVAALILLAGLGVGLFFVLGGDDTDAPGTAEASGAADVLAEEGEIFLEPVGDAGPDPFSGEVFVSTTPDSTPPILTATTASGGASTTSPAATGSTAAGGAVQVASVGGDTPALYGGSKNKRLVDKEGQLAFFESNPDKAAAFCAALNADPTFQWSGGSEIEPSQLRDYFAELTPLMLTRDTRVTNHGYKNGKPTPRHSVLQKGQMVLVDRYGVPRVRCECGNPLAPPRPVKKTPTYTGPKWPDFDPATVIVVQPTVVIINIFVVIDIDTGDTFDQPTGADGPGDAAPDQPDGTTVPGDAIGADPITLFDNGNIMAVYPGATPPTFELETTTLITKIVNYHYVTGGLPGAGLIGLQGEDGERYGPWEAVGTEGQGNVANAYWTVTPDDLVVPPGRYTIFDSDLSTYSQNEDSGGIGMTQVYGVPLR